MKANAMQITIQMYITINEHSWFHRPQLLPQVTILRLERVELVKQENPLLIIILSHAVDLRFGLL
jgi:hypothetical protein